MRETTVSVMVEKSSMSVMTNDGGENHTVVWWALAEDADSEG